MRGLDFVARVSTRVWVHGIWTVIALLLVLAAAASQIAVRNDLLVRAEERVQSLAKLSAENATRIFEGAELALELMAQRVGLSPEWDRIGQSKAVWDWLNWLVDQLDAAPRALLVDEQGVIRLHSERFPISPVSLFDRDHFQYHRTNPDRRGRINTPLQGRVVKQTIFPMTRRLERGDGTFAGEAILNLSPELIEEFYRSLGLEVNGFLVLQRRDGTILARFPHREGVVGTRIDNSRLFPEIAEGKPYATRVTTSPVDGVTRITGFHALAQHEAQVLVGMSHNDILAGWQRTVGLVGGALLTGLLVVTLLIEMLLRQHLRIRASENRYETFFQQSLDGMSIMEADRPLDWVGSADRQALIDEAGRSFKVVKVNDAKLAQYGARRDEFLGRPFNAFFAHDPDAGRKALADFLASGHLRMESEERRLDGTPIWIEGDYSATYDSKGRIVGIFGIQRDITAKRAAEQELRRTQFAIDRSAEMVFLVAADARYLYANEAAAKVLGFTRLELTQKRVFDLDLKFGPQVWAAAMDRLRQRGTLLFETSLRAKSGTSIPVEINGTYLSIDGCDYIYAFARDIRERKEAEERLLRSNTELEQFAYIASHDLREPLRTVTSYATLLERRLADRLDSDTREMLLFVRDGARRMNALVLDMLEYSRIGRELKMREPVAIGAALAAVRDNLHSALAESAATLVVETEMPVIRASGSEIERLFQNLIANGVKYRRPDVAPEIRLRALSKEGFWQFEVADNGIGIAPEHAERVFRIFHRLHGQNAYGGGTGIGLAICKKIVENHGGRIWIRSDTEGPGTTVAFTLPGEARVESAAREGS